MVHSTVYFDSPFPAGIVPSVSVSYSKMTNGQLVWTYANIIIFCYYIICNNYLCRGELFAHSISNTQFTVTSFQYSPGLTQLQDRLHCIFFSNKFLKKINALLYYFCKNKTLVCAQIRKIKLVHLIILQCEGVPKKKLKTFIEQ